MLNRRMRWMGLVYLLLHAWNAQGCESITGTYPYYGELLSGDAVSHYKYELEIAPYLGFNPMHLFMPKRAIITQDAADSTVVYVDVVAQGTLKEGTYSLPRIALPFRVQLSCQGGRWFRERTVQGGGENVRSTTVTKVFIEKTPDGDLIVDSHKTVTSGFFFPKIREWHRKIRFTSIQKSEPEAPASVN